jgi:hypothetical protein
MLGFAQANRRSGNIVAVSQLRGRCASAPRKNFGHSRLPEVLRDFTNIGELGMSVAGGIAITERGGVDDA